MAALRVAIIGYGLAGRVFHAPLIAATAELAVAAVVTANPQRRAQAAQDHPNARIVSSADELWQAPPDLVVVATPTASHVALTEQAIDHGVPVVVDKPLAIAADVAQSLVDRARAAGVLLTVFQNRRWDSDQMTLRQLLEQNALGTVIRYESRFERWRPEADPARWRDADPPEEGGGTLLDLGTHVIDQALVLLGPATHVYAEIDARRGAAADDDAFLALRHAGGAISHLRMSAFAAAPGPRLRVLGTEGAYVVTALDSQEDALRDGARPADGREWGAEPEFRWGRLIAGERSVPVRSRPGDWPRFYALLESALRDGEPPPVDPGDAVAALRVIEAARRSAASNSVVALAG